MRKKYSVALAAMAAALAVFGAAPAGANPPSITDVGKKIANFNIIATPHAWVESDSLCTNNGHRMFFSVDNTPWTVEWDFVPNLSPTFNILDCDGTTDRTAVIQEDAGVPVFIFIRVLGPRTASLDFVCQDVIDVNGVNECLISGVPLSHSKSFTKVTSHLFDTLFSEVLWTLDPSTNFKIAQVDVYEQA